MGSNTSQPTPAPSSSSPFLPDPPTTTPQPPPTQRRRSRPSSLYTASTSSTSSAPSQPRKLPNPFRRAGSAPLEGEEGKGRGDKKRRRLSELMTSSSSRGRASTGSVGGLPPIPATPEPEATSVEITEVLGQTEGTGPPVDDAPPPPAQENGMDIDPPTSLPSPVSTIPGPIILAPPIASPIIPTASAIQTISPTPSRIPGSIIIPSSPFSPSPPSSLPTTQPSPFPSSSSIATDPTSISTSSAPTPPPDPVVQEETREFRALSPTSDPLILDRLNTLSAIMDVLGEDGVRELPIIREGGLERLGVRLEEEAMGGDALEVAGQGEGEILPTREEGQGEQEGEWGMDVDPVVEPLGEEIDTQGDVQMESTTPATEAPTTQPTEEVDFPTTTPSSSIRPTLSQTPTTATTTTINSQSTTRVRNRTRSVADRLSGWLGLGNNGEGSSSAPETAGADAEVRDRGRTRGGRLNFGGPTLGRRASSVGATRGGSGGGEGERRDGATGASGVGNGEQGVGGGGRGRPLMAGAMMIVRGFVQTSMPQPQSQPQSTPLSAPADTASSTSTENLSLPTTSDRPSSIHTGPPPAAPARSRWGDVDPRPALFEPLRRRRSDGEMGQQEAGTSGADAGANGQGTGRSGRGLFGRMGRTGREFVPPPFADQARMLGGLLSVATAATASSLLSPEMGGDPILPPTGAPSTSADTESTTPAAPRPTGPRAALESIRNRLRSTTGGGSDHRQIERGVEDVLRQYMQRSLDSTPGSRGSGGATTRSESTAAGTTIVGSWPGSPASEAVPVPPTGSTPAVPVSDDRAQAAPPPAPPVAIDPASFEYFLEHLQTDLIRALREFAGDLTPAELAALPILARSAAAPTGGAAGGASQAQADGTVADIGGAPGVPDSEVVSHLTAAETSEAGINASDQPTGPIPDGIVEDVVMTDVSGQPEDQVAPPAIEQSDPQEPIAVTSGAQGIPSLDITAADETEPTSTDSRPPPSAPVDGSQSPPSPSTAPVAEDPRRNQLNFFRMFQFPARNTNALPLPPTAAPNTPLPPAQLIPVVIVGVRSINQNVTALNTGLGGEAGQEGFPFGEQEEGENASDAAQDPTAPSGSTENVTSPGGTTTSRWGARALRSLGRLRGNQDSQRRPNLETGPHVRNFVLYVVGGNYPQGHPILTIPHLFTGELDHEDLWALAEALGQVKPQVATHEDLKKSGLSVIKGREVKAANADGRVHDNTTDRCLICLSDYEDDEDCRIMSCKHLYHQECLDHWLVKGGNTCPCCRQTGVKVGDSTNDAPPIPASTVPATAEANIITGLND